MIAYVFDVETSDRKPPLEIIEAAWLRIMPASDMLGETPEVIPGMMSFSSWSQRYKPSVEISHGAMATHHILPSELEDCPPSSTFKLPEDCTYLIGHSISFDYEAIGSPVGVKLICTHAMAQWLWPEATGYSQSALTYMLYGATVEVRQTLRGAHSALADVMINYRLLQNILAMLPREITTWTQLHEFSEECRIPRTCPMKKYEGVLLENLDDGFARWCLRQDFIDPYYRKGLERLMDARWGKDQWYV